VQTVDGNVRHGFLRWRGGRRLTVQENLVGCDMSHVRVLSVRIIVLVFRHTNHCVRCRKNAVPVPVK